MSESANTKSVAITRKVSRLLDVTVNEQLWQVLHHVEDHCPELTASPAPGANRAAGAAPHRPVKTVLEERVLALHEAYLADFQGLRDTFLQVSNEVERMDRCGRDMEAQLARHHDEAAELLASVGNLRAELDEIRQKEQQVKRFMEQYALTPEETNTLHHGPINSRFLEALHKVRTIHRSCKELLASNHQQAAVEIMESMYLLHVAAAERLVKHLLNVVAEVMSQDVPEVSDVLIGCVRAVQDRPAQWTKVMHEVARIRKTAVLRRYYELLTKGNARTGRPLEAQAGDVVRFFGDLFAWLHQCIAEEGDLLDSFFGGTSPSQSAAVELSSSSSAGGNGSAEHTVSKADLMDSIFEVLCKHIKTRLETALDPRRLLSTGSHLTSQVVTFFQLESVVSHFAAKTAELLGPSAALTTLLLNGKLDVLRTFYDLLKQATQKMQGSHVRAHDVHVSPEAQELLRVLKTMMEYMDVSLVAHSDREAEFAPVLGAVIDPLLQSVLHSDMEAGKRCVLRLNLFSAIQAVLTGYSFAAHRQQKIVELVQQETAALTEFTTAKILSSFGFDERVTTDATLAWHVLQQLYSYTASAGSLPMPLVDSVHSVRLREAVATAVTETVCKAYEALFAATPTIPNVDGSAIESKKLRVMLDARHADVGASGGA